MSGKPINSQDEYCPLWRKHVSKVCHTCAWYRPLPVSITRQDGVITPTDVWACAIVQAMQLQFDMVRNGEETTASTDKVANEISGLSAEVSRQSRVMTRALDQPRLVSPPELLRDSRAR